MRVQSSQTLLRWSEHVPATDVQDPLGLSLRGSVRLASRLLYCITSITPRARYFSFIPWCVFDYQQREKGKPYALGVREAIILRERALTLGCTIHHEGQPCHGGSLVGSRDASRWYANNAKEADLKRLKLTKNPALDAYFNSLVNLGFFVTHEERPDADQETDTQETTLEDVQLTGLGLDLAQRYDSQVAALMATKQYATKQRVCTSRSLGEFGRRGGLCELAEEEAPDRQALRDIFFARKGSKGASHQVRRRSLLLILELCRQSSTDDWSLGDSTFRSAVYFGEIAHETQRTCVVLPYQLNDIATRWRMFYFHHFMGVALEGVFAWLVRQLSDQGLAGTSVGSLVARLDESSVSREVSKALGIRLHGSLGNLTPSVIFANANLPQRDLDAGFSTSLDHAVRSTDPLAEDNLEWQIRSGEYLNSPTGLALAMVLLVATLARYTQWEATPYGKWLASAAEDPYLDLVPPVLTLGLSRRFGKWWGCSLKDLASVVLSRYVVQQHQSMSYEKTWAGERCLLQVDGEKVCSTGVYDKLGLGNPRLGSAIQILKDLGLMDDGDGVLRLTAEGKRFLKEELACEIENEVS